MRRGDAWLLDGDASLPWRTAGDAVKRAFDGGVAWRAPMHGGAPITMLRNPATLERTPLRHAPAPTARGDHQPLVGGTPPPPLRPMGWGAWLWRQASFGWVAWRASRR